MLRKLFKHELKSSYLEITIVNIVNIFASTVFSLLIRATRNTVVIGLLIMSLVILTVIAFSIVIINIVRSFNNKMFSHEGYLTFTLPVKIDEIIISKIMANIIWYFITVFSTIFSIFIIIFINVDILDILIILKHLPLNEVPPMLISALMSIIDITLVLIFILLSLILLNIGKITKHKRLAGFGMFFGLSMISTWIKGLIRALPFRLRFSGGSYIFERIVTGMTRTGLINFNNLFWNFIFITSLYFLSKYLIKNKLELE